MFWRRERAETEDDEQKDLPPEESRGVRESRELGKISLTFHMVTRVKLASGLAFGSPPHPMQRAVQGSNTAMGWRLRLQR